MEQQTHPLFFSRIFFSQLLKHTRESSMILETERLYLREMNQDDFASLAKIIQDEDVMYAYEHVYSDDEVQAWLDKEIQRYKTDGFGMWAVVLKENDIMVGQCGITIQECSVTRMLEIGYLFQKEHWHKGYAIEAASACKDYAFQNINAYEVFSIIRDTNIASQSVARKNGMLITGKCVKNFHGKDLAHYIFSITNT